MIVYYRMCGIKSTNPAPVYEDDKLRLNKLCLKSFVQAYEDINPKVVFLCDWCPPEYMDMIGREVPFEKEIRNSTVGINESCLLQYELYESEKDDYVLFQECDYFHIAPITPSMLDVMDFVSPYDHPDKYPTEVSKIQIVDDWHFKQTISTTSTFACRREIYEAFKDTFKKFGYIDHARWVEIGEREGKLWTPIPSFATHMVKGQLSPGILWENLFIQL